ncbi:MAG: hypothetical protein MUE75_06590, partial [Algoriphagus sp.]|nr:hypothetical protein [Algoriphagus sp.]
MKKILKITLITLTILLIGLIGFGAYQFRDRHSGYNINLNLDAEAGIVNAGFAKVDITPKQFETWTDVDGDSRYNPEKGDTYEDSNGNGQFDAIWLAGFHNSRPAQSV